MLALDIFQGIHCFAIPAPRLVGMLGSDRQPLGRGREPVSVALHEKEMLDGADADLRALLLADTDKATAEHFFLRQIGDRAARSDVCQTLGRQGLLGNANIHAQALDAHGVVITRLRPYHIAFCHRRVQSIQGCLVEKIRVM